ncbi:MAG: hypothetical protein AB8B87_10720 [Granulosicoccus sp.]
MNFELVGIPGMGKSYLCRSVEEKILHEKALKKSGALPLTTPWLESSNPGRLLSTLRKLVRASTIACTHPATALKLFKVVFGNGQGFQKNRCTKYLNLMAEMQCLHKAGATTSLLTEQGVLQGVWSLEMLAETPVYDQIMRLIIPWLPDAIVVVEADSSQHKEQLTYRELGQSTFDQMRGEALSRAINQGEYNLIKILALWAELRPAGKRLNFNNEPDNDAQILFDWLSEQLR